ncbi:MAG: InlB B-repeat-containing protein [Clostridia bacterium]|nr:InlB B-repeat-containing protein [Clostridia bacterium]
MKGNWKKFFVALCMLPMVVFFPGCSCGKYNESVQTNRYENLTYTVRFYTDSTESFNIANQTVKHGNLVRQPQTPTKTGYRFIGWYTDTSWQNVWVFELHTVEKDMTLYARWEKRL